jgi:hypothetical protein
VSTDSNSVYSVTNVDFLRHNDVILYGEICVGCYDMHDDLDPKIADSKGDFDIFDSDKQEKCLFCVTHTVLFCLCIEGFSESVC